MNLPGVSTKKILVGIDAGWVLAFHRVGANGKVEEKAVIEISRADYYAEIDATLPSGLEGGTYTFTIEGLTDADYKQIKQNADKPCKVVRLYLFWRDTNQSIAGLAANFAGLTDVLGATKGKADPQFLVADLEVTWVERKVGERRYETVIEARERVYQQLTKKYTTDPPDKPVEYDDVLVAAETIAKRFVEVAKAYPFKPDVKKAAKKSAPESGKTALVTLQGLGESLEQMTKLRGRGLYLIRDGKLHIGERPIPLSGNTTDLTARTGLVEATPKRMDEKDPNAKVEPGKEAPKRQVYTLTLKGRPDIKPGDVVRFNPAPEDEQDVTRGSPFGAVGDLLQGPLVPSLGDEEVGKNAVSLYVNTIQHKLGRTKGFVTTITGVVIKQGDEWDSYSEPPGKDEEKSKKSETGSGADRAAAAVEAKIQRELEKVRLPEVGEVRAMATKGSDEPPGQSLTVWQGLEAEDGNPFAARRRAIRRKNLWQTTGVPYASPFAWGKCGLVLPRYPGTRVLLAYRNGNPKDPVEIGALWESGKGPESKPGDYWLILPADVQEPRDALGEKETPKEYEGKVTQDLIDADGNRVIEVGNLVVRVGKAALENAGDRPGDPVKKELVCIEHVKTSTRILIMDDGKLILESDENIEITTSKDLNISANNVNVSVSGKMDVS